MTDVGVLMTVYNGMPYLPAAVDSILSQTLRNFQFVIVDDGSTDGTATYLSGVTDSREATTTLYSFQDITGGGPVCFNRPVVETSIFLVIFHAESRQIAIRQLGATDFAFAGTISTATVDGWLADAGVVRTLN